MVGVLKLVPFGAGGIARRRAQCQTGILPFGKGGSSVRAYPETPRLYLKAPGESRPPTKFSYPPLGKGGRGKLLAGWLSPVPESPPGPLRERGEFGPCLPEPLRLHLGRRRNPGHPPACRTPLDEGGQGGFAGGLSAKSESPPFGEGGSSVCADRRPRGSPSGERDFQPVLATRRPGMQHFPAYGARSRFGQVHDAACDGPSGAGRIQVAQPSRYRRVTLR